MVRKLIADEQATGFTEGGNLEEPEGTQELENYLNRAVDEYSKRQAGLKDVRLVKEKEISDGGTLPTNYLAFCGAMPVRVLGNKIKFYVASSNPIAVRYFRVAVRVRPVDSNLSVGGNLRAEQARGEHLPAPIVDGVRNECRKSTLVRRTE